MLALLESKVCFKVKVERDQFLLNVFNNSKKSSVCRAIFSICVRQYNGVLGYSGLQAGTLVIQPALQQYNDIVSRATHTSAQETTVSPLTLPSPLPPACSCALFITFSLPLPFSHIPSIPHSPSSFTSLPNPLSSS